MHSNKIVVAEIVGVKGLKGELKIKSYSEDPLSIIDYELLDENNKVYSVLDAYVHKSTVIAKIEGITSINEAERIVGTTLYINKGALPELKDDSYYFVDLVGLSVINQAKQNIGSVIAVHNFGDSDIVEVKINSQLVMLPFNKELILEVNITGGYIAVNESLAKEYY